MRNLLFVLFFSFISLTFSQQLVRNGDFSQGSPEFGSVPPEWTVSPADSGGWRYVNSDGFMGEEDANANSVQFTVEENVGVLRQEITLQAQTEYVLAAALKANGAVPRIELVSPEGRTVTSLQGSADRHGIWRQAQVQFSSRHNTKLEIRLVGSVTAAKAGAQSGIDQISLLPADIAAAAKPAALTVKPFVAPGENIALHKPYTMRPAPSYGPSNDPDDKIQLTDGKYTQGYFWVQKSTVGWNRAFPVVITIDLGREEPIAGMSWNTAAGAAGVTWPTSLQIYVSSDEKTWYYQGDLVALGTRDAVPPSDKYGVFRYATDSLQTKGRYVQLIYSQTQYSFCDEIEIYRGQDAWLAQAAGEEAVASPMEAFRNKGMLSSINLRLQTDLLAAEENLTNLPANTPGRQAALAKIPALKAAVQKISAVDSATFQTILPLTPEHEAALALNAISLGWICMTA